MTSRLWIFLAINNSSPLEQSLAVLLVLMPLSAAIYVLVWCVLFGHISTTSFVHLTATATSQYRSYKDETVIHPLLVLMFGLFTIVVVPISMWLALKYISKQQTAVATTSNTTRRRLFIFLLCCMWTNHVILSLCATHTPFVGVLVMSILLAVVVLSEQNEDADGKQHQQQHYHHWHYGVRIIIIIAVFSVPFMIYLYNMWAMTHQEEHDQPPLLSLVSKDVVAASASAALLIIERAVDYTSTLVVVLILWRHTTRLEEERRNRIQHDAVINDVLNSIATLMLQPQKNTSIKTILTEKTGAQFRRFSGML
eukprot:PhM_4_TR13952/c0_g1_i1/m.101315